MYRSLAFLILCLLSFSSSAEMDGEQAGMSVAMAQHYVDQFSSVSALITVIGFAVGLFFMAKAWIMLPKLADRGERQNVGPLDLLLYFIFGTLMVYMVMAHVVFHESLFASEIPLSESPFVYSFTSVALSSDAEKANAQMLQYFFKMIGSCAFFYGLLLGPTISRTHPKHREAGLGKVLGFTISGVLAMFPVMTLSIFAEFIPFLKVFLNKLT